MSSMICSDIKAFVMARCLESVMRTSYDMAHTDDVHCGLWTVGGMLRYYGTRHGTMPAHTDDVHCGLWTVG